MRDFFERNRSSAPRKIGAEFEHFLVADHDLRSYGYEEPQGSCAMMLKLLEQKWYLNEVSRIGPLYMEKRESALTLEPGGQIELSLRPMNTIGEIAAEYADLMGEIGRCLREDQSLVSLGYHPASRIDSIALLPKPRYAIMEAYFRRLHPAGLYMMKGTASTQVSVDYRDLDDFNRKFQVANYLADALYALFDAAPVFEGHVTGAGDAETQTGAPVCFEVGDTLRQAIWKNTDPSRTMLPREQWSFEGYIDFLLDSKPILMMDNGDAVETGEQTVAELLAENRFGPEHLSHFLTMVFPPVRFKGYLEVRVPDAVPARYRMAVPAVIGELMYREDLLETYHALYREARSYRGADGTVSREFLLDLLHRVGDARTVDPDGAAKDALCALQDAIRTHGSIAESLRIRYREDMEAFRAEVLEKPQLRADYDFDRYDVEKAVPDWESPAIRRAEQICGSLAERWTNRADRREEFERIDRLVQASQAYYKGEIVPYLHLPMLYHEADLACFRDILHRMHLICEKMIRLYQACPEVRALYDFDPRIETLILQPLMYEPYVPMGRFDIFYHGKGEFQFCELNTDGSSAMNEEAELNRCIRQSAVMQEIRDLPKVWTQSFELFHSWVDAIKPIYHDFTSGWPNFPVFRRLRVAIVDFLDSGVGIEFERFRQTFLERGYDCEVVDPRQIKVQDGFMTVEGRRIDIVYRRLVTADLLNRYDEIPGFIEGLGQKTCVIGSLHTQVVHSKRFFEMLHHPELEDVWTPQEKEWIERHIPHTEYLSARHLEDPQITTQKDAYILKPIDSYASKGVVTGMSATDAEWLELLREKADAGYIIQKYAKQPVNRNLHPRTMEIESFHTITGLFTYAKQLAGVYVRAGKKDIISGLHDGFTMATFGLIVE